MSAEAKNMSSQKIFFATGIDAATRQNALKAFARSFGVTDEQEQTALAERISAALTDEGYAIDSFASIATLMDATNLLVMDWVETINASALSLANVRCALLGAHLDPARVLLAKDLRESDRQALATAFRSAVPVAMPTETVLEMPIQSLRPFYATMIKRSTRGSVVVATSPAN